MENNTSASETESCLISGDISFEGDIVEETIIIVGSVINVTGNVVLTGEVTMVLVSEVGALHVGKCLIMEDQSQILVLLNDGVNTNSTITLATYDYSCDLQIDERVKINTSAFDVCLHGQPVVRERDEGDERKRLELFFVPMSDSSECHSASDLNMIALAIAVPIAVLVAVTIVVVFAVPRIRKKVFPFARKSKSKSKS